MYDIKNIRNQFPMLNGKSMQGKTLVYLDNAATTFKPQCVIDAMNDYYTTFTSNAHRGDYDLSYNMDQKILNVRETVARFVNCDSNEVIFTSGDTMSLNMIAWGFGLKFLNKGDEIILSEEEHASNFLPWLKIADITGAVIKYVPINEKGKITPENLEKVISNKTKVVSLAQISNVLGYLNDIKSLTKIAHKVGAIMIVDGAQSVPHVSVDFKDLDIDFLTFSAHKMCGPTGIGALIGKAEWLNKIDPIITGGGMNQSFGTDGKYSYLKAPAKFEAGTQNLSGILGLGKCIDFLNEIGLDAIYEHEQELLKYAYDKLKDNDKLIIYNKDADVGLITFNVKDIFPQDEATLLNSKGIAIRSGHHCAKALPNYLNTYATCRASFYLYNNKEDIDAFCNAINEGGDILDAYFLN